MNIDISMMKKHWFEDAEGNVYEEANEKTEFYHSCFPCEISHEIDSYRFHPEGMVQKMLSRIPLFRKILENKHGKTFHPMVTFHTYYGGSQETIVAMVNSGDYTLEQAIWVYTTACERCMNVLAHKYSPELDDGYEEFSDEWYKCGTSCLFCENEGDKTNESNT